MILFTKRKWLSGGAYEEFGLKGAYKASRFSREREHVRCETTRHCLKFLSPLILSDLESVQLFEHSGCPIVIKGRNKHGSLVSYLISSQGCC